MLLVLRHARIFGLIDIGRFLRQPPFWRRSPPLIFVTEASTRSRDERLQCALKMVRQTILTPMKWLEERTFIFVIFTFIQQPFLWLCLQNMQSIQCKLWCPSKAIISSALVLILAVLTLHETFSYKTAISHRMHTAASSRHLARWWFRRKPSKHSHTRPSPSPCSALRGWTSAAPILVVRSHQGPPPITSPSITPKPIHLPTPQIPDNRFYPPLCPYLTPSGHNEEPHHPPPAPPPTPRLPPVGLGWGLPKPPLQVSLLIGEIQQAAFCFAGGKYASALTSLQCKF